MDSLKDCPDIVPDAYRDDTNLMAVKVPAGTDTVSEVIIFEEP
jgi:hypothetical protein